MPTTADNRAFAMTMFPNLKALIMTANGQSPAYESDNEVVLGATECYNVSDGEPVPTDSYDGTAFYNVHKILFLVSTKI